MSLTNCRVCENPLSRPNLFRPAPALSSVRSLLPVATKVYVCDVCGHGQSPDLPALDDFYDTQYRISLEEDGYDQLYESVSGGQVFRTKYQAEIVLSFNVPSGARVLDFGSGKATTLRELFALRSDIEPYVFDVSSDYLEYWDAWIPRKNQAVYKLPEEWLGNFELITAHFVLEHVADPLGMLKILKSALAPAGRILFSVPNAEANVGDLLVADHLNHFTRSSLEELLARAGLSAECVEENLFQGAFVVAASLGETVPVTIPQPENLKNVLIRWQSGLNELGLVSCERPLAIYGAGFYGSVIATCLGDKVSIFLDKNPYLQSKNHFGLPVVHPDDCPKDVRTVIVGLNPRRAHVILGEGKPWLPNGAKLFFLDEFL